MKPNPLYVIEYYQGKSLVETIGQDDPMPRSVMRWKQKELRRTTHKTGILIPVCINKEQRRCAR